MSRAHDPFPDWSLSIPACLWFVFGCLGDGQCRPITILRGFAIDSGLRWPNSPYVWRLIFVRETKGRSPKRRMKQASDSRDCRPSIGSRHCACISGFLPTWKSKWWRTCQQNLRMWNYIWLLYIVKRIAIFIAPKVIVTKLIERASSITHQKQIVSHLWSSRHRKRYLCVPWEVGLMSRHSCRKPEPESRPPQSAEDRPA